MIVVVDYHKGNIKSVERGVEAAGAQVCVSDSPAELAAADGIVLPGVGAFADAMYTLDELGLTDVLRERIAQNVPFLGICLGLHLMFEGGTEHANEDTTRGLGVLSGIVEKLPSADSRGNLYKVPHVGWNSVEFDETAACPLFACVPQGEFFYFTHSYIAPSCEAVVAKTAHSVTFPSAVQKGNAFGVQFHPEKSSSAGAKVLRNFVNLVDEVGSCERA